MYALPLLLLLVGGALSICQRGPAPLVVQIPSGYSACPNGGLAVFSPPENQTATFACNGNDGSSPVVNITRISDDCELLTIGSSNITVCNGTEGPPGPTALVVDLGNGCAAITGQNDTGAWICNGTAAMRGDPGPRGPQGDRGEPLIVNALPGGCAAIVGLGAAIVCGPPPTVTANGQGCLSVTGQGSGLVCNGSQGIQGIQGISGTTILNSSVTFSSLALSAGGLANSIAIFNATAGLQAIQPTNGQVLIGSTGAAPVAASITGTLHQIAVAGGAASITLSTPQNIDVSSAPTFVSQTLTAASNQLLLGTTNTVQINAAAPAAPRTYTIPDAGTASASFMLTAGTQAASGALTLSNTLTLSGLAGSSVLSLNSGSQVTATALTNGQLLIGSTGTVPTATTITGTANQVNVANGAGSITLSTPQNIAAASSPTFAGLTISGASLNSACYFDGSTTLSTAALSNGQILVGATGSSPLAATITGTPNQISVTNAANSITLSTPQPIALTSSPTFKGITLTSGTANGALYFNGTGVINGAALTNGQLLIGSTGTVPTAATITGTANQVNVANSAGGITLSTPQNIAAASSPTFAGLTITGATAKSVPYFDASSVLQTAALTNGQVLVGSTGAIPVAAALTGTTNQITVTNGAGTITLGTPQNIAVASSPTFVSETLTQTTNQLVLGTTKTTTISATQPANSATYTIPDAGTTANFMMTAGSQTASGVTTFSNAAASTTTGTGAVVITGGLGVGGSIFSGAINTGSQQITTTGGINFGNSALHSYIEAGTWTPALYTVSGGTWTLNAGHVLSTAVGTYTRIGNVVFAFVQMVASTGPSGGNPVGFNLPITASAVAQPHHPLVGHLLSVTSQMPVCAPAVGVGFANINLGGVSGQGYTNMVPAQWPNNGEVLGAFYYWA